MLLSNSPLQAIYNNLDGIYDDSTRVRFSLDGDSFTAKCFNRLQTIRKDHVNNKELLGLLMCPILTYHYLLLQDLRVKGKKQAEGQTEEDPMGNKRSSLRKSSLTQFPNINKVENIPRNLQRLGKFIVKFKVRFPVFKRFLASQGVGGALTVNPFAVDHLTFARDFLSREDFANDAFFMSLFYFVTLFAKNDPNFNEVYFQNFLFEFFIKNRWTD